MATGLAQEIVAQFTTLLKGSALTAEEKQLLKDCAIDAADVQVQVLSGEMSKAKGAAENRQIDAQVKTIGSIAAGRVSALFWKAVNLAVSVLSKAITV